MAINLAPSVLSICARSESYLSAASLSDAPARPRDYRAAQSQLAQTQLQQRRAQVKQSRFPSTWRGLARG